MIKNKARQGFAIEKAECVIAAGGEVGLGKENLARAIGEIEEVKTVARVPANQSHREAGRCAVGKFQGIAALEWTGFAKTTHCGGNGAGNLELLHFLDRQPVIRTGDEQSGRRLDGRCLGIGQSDQRMGTNSLRSNADWRRDTIGVGEIDQIDSI